MNAHAFLLRQALAPAAIPSIKLDGYQPHALHSADRMWPETNCSVDLWVEVIASLGLDPLAAMAFTVAQDFEGDHFTFFKIPPEDLESLYGIRLGELAIFDKPEEHAAEQVARGRLPMIELDSYFMPDTGTVAYRTEHGKTTVGINRIDLAGKRMEYFHNAGYFALEGEDFDGIWKIGTRSAEEPFYPYAEFAKLPETRESRDLKPLTEALFSRHLKHRPNSNPVEAFMTRFAAQAEALYERPAFFHKYAFNTLRQLGANFELMAATLTWLGEEAIAADALAIAENAKTVQFQLARAVARRRAEALPPMMVPALDAWERLMHALDRRFA